MRVLGWFGRALAGFLSTIAKTIGGMAGAKTFDHDNAPSLYKRRDDYRP